MIRRALIIATLIAGAIIVIWGAIDEQSRTEPQFIPDHGVGQGGQTHD